MTDSATFANRFNHFLCWLATADANVLRHCPTQGSRFTVIGYCVLATWTFATLAWTYFFSTVAPLLPAILLGLLMGAVILIIDRALIKGMGSDKVRLFPLLLRGLLAATIGAFMAQPALLYLFDKEIKTQTALDNEQRRQQKRAALDTLYLQRKNSLELERQIVLAKDSSAYAEVQTARQAFISEADGSGGTGKVGLKTIALAKQAEYQRLATAYEQAKPGFTQQATNLNTKLAVIEKDKQAAETAFANSLSDGFLTRIQALSNLLKTSTALKYRYYLLLAILLLIELIPVIAKTLLPTPGYDAQLQRMQALEQNAASNNHDLQLHYNQLARQANETAVNVFMADFDTGNQPDTATASQQWQVFSNNRLLPQQSAPSIT